MGLQNRTTKGVYVKIKDGKFMLVKDDTGATFDELEGKLVDLYFKDETFEGQVQRKLYLVMNDGDENLIINFRFDSRYATDFIKFVKNIDLSEAFTLCPTSKEKQNGKGETVKEQGLLVKQDGTFAKSFYTRDKPNGLPAMRKVKLNGKEMWDKTEMLEFYEAVVERELKPAVSKNKVTTSIKEETYDSSPKTYQGADADDASEEVFIEDETDDLPWEK